MFFRRLFFLGSLSLSLGLLTKDSGAALFEWPPGVKFDFRVCRAVAENQDLLKACNALGLLECDGAITGNAFIVQSVGPKDVIVGSAHSFISEETGRFFSDCRFLLMGKTPGPSINKVVVLSTSPYASYKYPDVAVAQLEARIESVDWRLPLFSVNRLNLADVLGDPSKSYSVIAIHPDQKIPVVTAYPCTLVSTPSARPGAKRTEIKHNCPEIPGFSGSPVMLHQQQERKFAAACIHSSGHQTLERKPFDPERNSNSCAVIPPIALTLIESLSSDKPIKAPRGGATKNYRTLSGTSN